MSGLIVAAIVAVVAAVAVRATVRRFKAAQGTFDQLVDSTEADRIVIADEQEHVTALSALTFVPDGFTCLRCEENPALPERVWCAVCAPIVAQYPAEPIERGGLR